MAVLRLQISVLVASTLLTGCLSTSTFNDGDDISAEVALAACREKWDWGDMTEVFGRPTFVLTRLNHPLISMLFPKSVAYRVTMAERDFIVGSGPPTRTISCLVNGRAVTFLETDSDVLNALSSIDATSLDASGVLDLLIVFAKLRGMELQFGLPSKDNPWAVVSDDGEYPLVWQEKDLCASHWSIELNRSGNTWEAKATFVSPDTFYCYRYVLHVNNSGSIEIKSTEDVFRYWTIH